MTTAAIDALRADHAALIGMSESFSNGEWHAPSACPGWEVRDVLAHMTQLFRQVVDPGALPPPDPSGSTERTNDRWVEAIRDQPVDNLVADYSELGAQAADVLAGLQGNEEPLALGDLGTYPLHLTANAFAFDHYVHIRSDLLSPTGPIDRPPPATDDQHLCAVADWIEAGIPQMSPDAITGPILLVLTGPGGRATHFGPDGEPAATITSSVEDLVLWSTRRRAWRDLEVDLDGDTEAAEAFCDAVHVI